MDSHGTDRTTDGALLALAFDLAAEAARVILDVRSRGFVTHRKADRSVVTEADHAAETVIVAGLRAVTPRIPVVAEEEIAAGHMPDHADQVWQVDPLDGTREFARGGDDYAVNIGLVRDRRAVLGVVAVPATGEAFGGILGLGAWKRLGGRESAIRARPVPSEGATVLASRHSGGDPRLGPFLLGRHVARVVNMGSAIKFVRLAEGEGDLYPRFGRTMEWDTAAPQAVLEAAGGTVRLCADGGPLRYGKPDWENPSFYCTGLV